MKAVVNVSTQKYRNGQERLYNSLKQYPVSLLFFHGEKEIGCLPHSQSMYGFKPYAMELARNAGATSVLWLDASMVAIKDISPIFDHIEKHGYFFQDSGWMNNQWTNDATFDYFDTDAGPMMSTGVLGLDFNNKLAIQFFEYWMQSCKDGIFNGSHTNHRHDQTCASIIAHKLRMGLTENNTYWNYGKYPFHENIVILADGIS